MRRLHKVVVQLLTTSAFLGVVIGAAHAGDAKVYPGSMAVKYSSGGTLVYSASAVGNSDPNNYAYVDLPIINDTMAASISASFVKVLDRSPTYNHRCSVNSVYWNTAYDRWFGSWGANKYSSSYGDQLQVLYTNGIGGTLLADHSSDSIEDNAQRVNDLEQDLMVIRQDIKQLIELQQNNSEVLASLGNPQQVSSVQKNTPEVDKKLRDDTENIEATKLVEREYQLQDALSNEEVDLQWVNEITQTVQQGFESAELDGINLNNMVCGATICQLDIQIDESLTSQEGLQRLSTNRTWDGETTFSLDGNGNLKLFFAKKGHQLPGDS